MALEEYQGERASPQNDRGRPAWWSIEMMACSMVLLARSATPFCCGLALTECCLWIPCSAQKSSKSLPMYSPPLSSLRALMMHPVLFSAQALNFLKLEKASDFFFIRYTPLNLPESSM